MTERAQALEAALIGAGVLAQEVLASRQNVGNYLRQLAQSVLNDLSTTENIPQPIQRFDLVSVSFAYTSDHEMQRSDDGEWVRFDDVFPPAALSPVEPTPPAESSTTEGDRALIAAVTSILEHARCAAPEWCGPPEPERCVVCQIKAVISPKGEER